MMNGFHELVEKEVAKFAPNGVDVNVIAHPNRIHAAWIGGSILASSDVFRQMAITKQKYEEYGENLALRK